MLGRVRVDIQVRSQSNVMIILPKGERNQNWNLPKGTWKRVKKSDGNFSAMIACPECGQEGSISNHAITPDGTVTPSVVCGYDKCTFHDYVKLDGWIE